MTIGRDGQHAPALTALGKALQLGGHLAIRLGKTDLALSSLERALTAAGECDDPLLKPMLSNSIAWAYQRQDRLGDAQILATTAADEIERGGLDTAERLRVWGGLLISAATSTARKGDYERAAEMLIRAEDMAGRLSHPPTTEGQQTAFGVQPVRGTDRASPPRHPVRPSRKSPGACRRVTAVSGHPAVVAHLAAPGHSPRPHRPGLRRLAEFLGVTE